MLSGISALQSAIGTPRLTESAAAQGPGASGTTDFADALGSTAMKTVQALENAETLSLDGLKGGVETREVVDAVMSAEQSLQAAIAIRDKIVQAYLEISRMQI